jgi:hypothetical protein
VKRRGKKIFSNSGMRAARDRRISSGDTIKHFDATSAAPVAVRGQGRPRAETYLGQFGLESLLWKSFANWMRKNRKTPKGLPSRTELWNAVPDKRRYFAHLAYLAFANPQSAGAREVMGKAYTTAPDLTCEALLHLRARARDLKVNERYRIAVFEGFSSPRNMKLSASDRALQRDMREARRDFVARTVV